MLSVTRRSIIKDIIQEKKSVTVGELAKQFTVTEETIRRDLKALEEEGVLIRTYGGAFIQDGVRNDISSQIRETAFVDSKHRIARLCKQTLHNGDTIFLDCSTTSSYLCDVIHTMRLTVITNSLLITNKLRDLENIKLITVGGIFDRQNMAFVGKGTLLALSSYYVDKAFLSCRSLSIEHGVTDANEHSAEIRALMQEHANEVYLIADHTKFDKTSFVRIGDFSKISVIVTDEPLREEWHTFCDQNQISLLEDTPEAAQN